MGRSPDLSGFLNHEAALGAIAAGAFYGLSVDLAWHAWYQLNLAAGMLFLPLALEAAVRLRRRPALPAPRQA